jgi:uncharacterized phage protein (TIGR01671 family)
MTRAIKFRGKRTDNGEWAYGYLIHDSIIRGKGIAIGTKEMSCEGEVSCRGFRVAPSAVGQFTGLHDKNGKEIYEGDIIKYELIGWNGSVAGLVLFDAKKCSFTVENAYADFHDDFDKSMDAYCEVIGNIHDNPELLAR